MALPISPQEPPLRTNRDGVILVGNTRVPLETVITVFNLGATPEEIVQQFPSLSLPDVYLVIGYYLQNHADVDEYIRQQQAESARVRQENEARFDPAGIRERLLSRRKTT
jgi:uncharacterized protein (DUF433 family)